MQTAVIPVSTPAGPGRWHVDAATDPVATLLLGHGAGGGVNAEDLAVLARRLPPEGLTVMRFEQPWRTAGRKVAVPPAQLDVGWRAAVDWLLAEELTAGSLWFGGRSAGARVACRTANDYGVAGVVCLAFPLHPPGRPERSRASELMAPAAPRLVLQGASDAFGRPEEIRDAVGDASGVTLVELPGADHGYRVAKGAEFSGAMLRARLVDEVIAFVAAGAVDKPGLRGQDDRADSPETGIRDEGRC